jgi:ubiquinone biosynthesis protein Coq4
MKTKYQRNTDYNTYERNSGDEEADFLLGDYVQSGQTNDFYHIVANLTDSPTEKQINKYTEALMYLSNS